MKKSFYTLFVSVLLIGCSVDPIETSEGDLLLNSTAKNGNPHAQFDIPTIEAVSSGENSLKIGISAGESGATGGLSIRWMTEEEYENFGWQDELAGHVLLNGHADDTYSLEPNEDFIFALENYISGEGESWNRALECGQTYFFKVRAHQDGTTQMSGYSDPQSFSTEACEPVDPCNLLGEETYSDTMTYSYVDSKVDDVGQIYNFLLTELMGEDIVRGGSFSLTSVELLRKINRWYAGTEDSVFISVTYTVSENDCTDSAVFELTITRD